MRQHWKDLEARDKSENELLCGKTLLCYKIWSSVYFSSFIFSTIGKFVLQSWNISESPEKLNEICEDDLWRWQITFSND